MAKRARRVITPARRSPAQASPILPVTRALVADGAIWASLGLMALSLVVFAPVVHFQFVSWDDSQYILDNPHVTGGLTWANAWWALTSSYASNWHPLTWWSHMLDVDWYGLSAGPHHATSLALHMVSTLLLFGVLRSATGAFAKSLFVAALFAVHPLHVESVAWVAERKDVLSTVFWLLTIWAYLKYVRHPRLSTYVVVVVSLALGLMAKPMLVTVPFVLLLLDFWPLERTALGIPRLILEKIPLFLLVGASSVITFAVQQHGGAVAASAALPLSLRLENAIVSYAMYIVQMLWPARLAAVYPHAKSLPAWEIAASVATLAVLSALVILLAHRRKYLVTGWLWFLGTLVPVIGLVQVGSQARADRYTYVPLIGLFIIVAWGLPDLLARAPRPRQILMGAAGLVVIACAVLARLQVDYWRDSLSLWDRAVQVTAGNFIAEDGLGAALAEQGRGDEAMAHFQEAVHINPDYPYAQNNLAIELRRRHQDAEAIAHFKEALRTKPDLPETHNNLANALGDQDRFDEAIAEYSTALRLRPGYVGAHNGLGIVLSKAERFDEAIAQFSEALRLEPRSVQMHNNFAIALAAHGQFPEAAREFSEALRLDPGNALARRSLAEIATLSTSAR